MKAKRVWLIFAVCVLAFGVLAACGQADSSDAGSDGSAEGSAGQANDNDSGNASDDASNEETDKKDAAGADSITASGSSALQPLVQEAADAYMKEHSEATINVQGGGSGTGLSQVSEQQVAIGNSDVFAEEKEDIPADKLVDHKVAVVGMAAVVHPEVGIDDIKQDDLIKVFTGKVKNWKELGGADEKITLVNRPDSSGTRATFETYALKGEKSAEGITEDSSGTVQKIISETPGAIGYLALSYLQDDSIKALKIDGVEATEDNIATNDYSVWAYQHMYTHGEPEGLTKQFLDYMLSDEVQNNLVSEMGYMPVTKMKVERDAEGKVENK